MGMSRLAAIDSSIQTTNMSVFAENLFEEPWQTLACTKCAPVVHQGGLKDWVNERKPLEKIGFALFGGK